MKLNILTLAMGLMIGATNLSFGQEIGNYKRQAGGATSAVKVKAPEIKRVAPSSYSEAHHYKHQGSFTEDAVFVNNNLNDNSCCSQLNAAVTGNYKRQNAETSGLSCSMREVCCP